MKNIFFAQWLTMGRPTGLRTPFAAIAVYSQWAQNSRILGLLAVLLLLSSALHAQSVRSVAGTLLDAGTGQPLPFANILVLHAADSTLVGSGQTTEGGAFQFDRLLPGPYLLRVAALGYQPARRRVTLAAGGPAVKLGNWRIAPAAVQLGGVAARPCSRKPRLTGAQFSPTKQGATCATPPTKACAWEPATRSHPRSS